MGEPGSSVNIEIKIMSPLFSPTEAEPTGTSININSLTALKYSERMYPCTFKFDRQLLRPVLQINYIVLLLDQIFISILIIGIGMSSIYDMC